MHRLFQPAVLLALFAGALLSANAQETLRGVSPHPEAMLNEFERSFAAWMSEAHDRSVKIEWLDQGGTSNIKRFIQSEFQRSPDGINVDLFFGGGVDSYIEFAEKELFEPHVLPKELLEQIGEKIAGVPVYDEKGRWYGVALSGFGMMYNNLMVRRFKLPTVATWEDMTDPRLVGRIAAADPRNSGSAHMVYEIILQAYGWKRGWQILHEIGGNVKQFTEGASDVPGEVARGSVFYGPVIDFYAYAQIAKAGEDKLTYIMPEGLSVINPDPIAILKGAPNMDLAKLFVEHCLSPEGQKLLILPKGDPEGPRNETLARLSVLPKLYAETDGRAVVKSNPFEIQNAIEYNPDIGGARWTLVNDLFGALIIDAHKDLSSSWKAVGKGTQTARLKLGEMPINEEEAAELAKSWNDPDYALTRKRTVSEWRQFAREKYNAAKRLNKRTP